MFRPYMEGREWKLYVPYCFFNFVHSILFRTEKVSEPGSVSRNHVKKNTYFLSQTLMLRDSKLHVYSLK